MRISLFLILLLGLLATVLKAEETSAISFGAVQLGEKRLNINLKDFETIISVKNLKIKTRLMKETIQWVRVNQLLLSPRVKIEILVQDLPENISLRYNGTAILMQQIKNRSYANLFISLFQGKPIEVFRNGRRIGDIVVSSRVDKQKGVQRQLIDYSCAPYHLEILGLEGEFLSAGCQLSAKGKFGKVKASLEIHWTSPDFKLLNGDSPPYVVTMIPKHPVKLTVKDHSGRRRLVTMVAKIPTKIHSMKTAIGIGPYQFDTEEGMWEDDSGYTLPLMLYGNLTLTETSSLRFFDAFFWKGSYFNNAGLYFAYDVAEPFDKRFKITPLIGFQGITFKNANSGNKAYSEVIYPQGFEFVYRHAFGRKNFHLVYGMFFSPTSDEDYKNIWVRWGTKYFWELNFLSWKTDQRYSRAWGISVGIPFLKFF